MTLLLVLQENTFHFTVDLSVINESVGFEIPVCGTRFLYDNGLSVCGFKWKQETSIAPLTVNTMIQSIHFVGDNVVCKGTACPTVGKWTVGDIVYNTGTASNNAMWIYTANGWQAR